MKKRTKLVSAAFALMLLIAAFAVACGGTVRRPDGGFGLLPPGAQAPDDGLVEVGDELEGPLLDAPGVRDEHDEQMTRADRHQLDVPQRRAPQRRPVAAARWRR